MSQVSARLVGRVSSQRLLTWGLVAIALGGISMLVVALSGIGLIGILLSFFVIAASLGLILPNSAALALANVRAAGSASALLGMFQLLIGAVAGPLVGLGGSASAAPIAPPSLDSAWQRWASSSSSAARPRLPCSRV